MSDLIKQMANIPDEYEPCEDCSGTGQIEETLGGFGNPEYDAMTVCPFCAGTGKKLIYEL